MWSDAHTHLEQYQPYADYLKRMDIRAIVNSQTPTEWQWNQRALAEAHHVTTSYGVHPWDSDRGVTADDLKCLRAAPVIGEIGLDQEWTAIPLTVQQLVFEKQLALATAWQKPVILHTKAAEREVLETIQHYPTRYLIHWYDCPDYIEDFIQCDCWFSIGPDVDCAPHVQRLARRVPTDKLLLETDGLRSVDWAYGIEREGLPAPERWVAALEASAWVIAELRGTTVEAILTRSAQNLEKFLQ